MAQLCAHAHVYLQQQDDLSLDGITDPASNMVEV